MKIKYKQKLLLHRMNYQILMTTLFFYVDNTSIIFNGKNHNPFNNTILTQLSALDDWFLVNSLSMNESNTKAISLVI